MAILTPHIIRADRFSWKGTVGSAEISGLGPDFRFEPVFDDAADVGITVINPISGKQLVFAVHETIKNEGDIQYWNLVCVTDKKFQITIFND